MITSQSINPFVLMMNPESVLRAVESSERLQRLQRRVFRPLDTAGPLNPLAMEAASFDALLEDIDGEDPTDEGDPLLNGT